MTKASDAKSAENTIETDTGDIPIESGVRPLCFCQKCCKLIPGILEIPCRERSCPECGSKLLRI